MDDNPFQKAPYFDWTIDGWKLGLIVVLFFLLVLTTLVRPEWAFTWPDQAAQPNAVGATEEISANVEAEAAPTVASSAVMTDTLTPGASVALPLTLANLGPNAVVPAAVVMGLYGTGRPGALVEVRDLFVPSLAAGQPVVLTESEGRVLGAVPVDGRGLWQLAEIEPLVPGQHVLELAEVDDQGAQLGASVPVVVSVLESDAEAPLSLATPAIRFPSAGARLQAGRITYLGSALPGMQIKLYVDNRLVGEAVAGVQGEWQVSPETSLPAGVYVARAAAINPQGDIVAESAPVAFAVFEAEQGAIPAPLPPSPGLPLQVSNAVYADEREGVLLLNGLATPFTSVGAWMGEQPLWFVNTRVDGRWQMWLVDAGIADLVADLTLRSNLDEVVTSIEAEVIGRAAAPIYPPVLISPATGEVLTTRQPVLLGLAQPASEVSVLVNNTEVARVLADRQGQWAVQVNTPLPAGEVALAAVASGGALETGPATETVSVTVSPSS